MPRLQQTAVVVLVGHCLQKPQPKFGKVGFEADVSTFLFSLTGGAEKAFRAK